MWSGGRPARAQGLQERLSPQVSTFQLRNGLRVVVMERHQAPVVSLITYAQVGSVDEPPGQTGIAHVLEHLAFKGTSRIGTRNASQERALLAELDRIAAQLGHTPLGAKRSQLEQHRQDLQAAAGRLVEDNAFSQILRQAGAVGLNATTSADATRYVVSLPAHKLELWFSLESERFLDPVFRQLEPELEVIREEQRLRVENNPSGRLVEAFLETALPDSPYGRPVIGYPQDFMALDRGQIRQFFQNHYGPGNLVVAIVGDVNPQQVRRLAEVYFGRYRPRPMAATAPPRLSSQTAPRRVVICAPAQPQVLIGYPRPAATDPDEPVYQVISGLLTSSRTSRLYRQLVVEQGLALGVNTSSSFPGERYPNLFVLSGRPAGGHSPEELVAAIEAELARLRQEPVRPAELAKVKRQAQVSVLSTLNDNTTLASLLAESTALTGTWQTLINQVSALEAVTPADVQRVAQALFRPEAQTVAILATDPFGTGYSPTSP
ncbi:MAG: insulinase family protein [Gloeomargaritaceae cyanobacterium C42_A2020_066]|nr:insulinase family protein [Gloeomargaritaceae cyanobacterium C42_A2020_066]